MVYIRIFIILNFSNFCKIWNFTAWYIYVYLSSKFYSLVYIRIFIILILQYDIYTYIYHLNLYIYHLNFYIYLLHLIKNWYMKFKKKKPNIYFSIFLLSMVMKFNIHFISTLTDAPKHFPLFFWIWMKFSFLFPFLLLSLFSSLIFIVPSPPNHPLTSSFSSKILISNGLL